MMEWKPIETAPKDGSDVVGWCGRYVVCHWVADWGIWVISGDRYEVREVEPTHYVAPAPPEVR